MTSTNTARLVVPAPANTPCGWWTYTEAGRMDTCQGGRDAVHVLTATLPIASEGTALCGFHSPYDVTEADRAATNGTEAEVSGVEILADMLTLEPVAEVHVFDVVKFHKMSAPMLSVTLAVAAKRGEVDAWAMRNIVLPSCTKATKATVTALMRRGILAEVIRDNDGTPGSLTAYRLTDTGRDLVAVLGCPVTFLPTDPTEADKLVAEAGHVDCETECNLIMSEGPHALPVGGTVCFGCGSTYTRSGEDTHPGTLAVSDAVIRRNIRKGLIPAPVAVIPARRKPILRLSSGPVAVDMRDVAEVGMRMAWAAGSPRNGTVEAVSEWTCVLLTDAGDRVTVDVVDLVALLNNCDVSTYMPTDAGAVFAARRRAEFAEIDGEF